MDYRYKQLEQDLSALSTVFNDLGSRLSEAAKDVSSGVQPSEKLIEQILTARTTFDNVRNAVHGQAEAMLVSPLPKTQEIASILAIGALLKSVATAEESKNSAEGEIERATSLLSRVLAISHREMAAFQPLQDCHAKVSELRSAISKGTWPNRHPDAESVIALRHPSTVLLTFVENLDTLEDEKYMLYESMITDAFGKQLFVAASRGKLVAQPSTAQPSTAKPSQPQSAKPAPAAEKPVERKPAPEKLSEKTVTSAPVVAHPAPAHPVVAHVEKKETPAAPAHVPHSPAVAPVPVAPAAVAQAPTPAPTVAPPAPAQLTPITSTTLPQRPPAPVPMSEAPTVVGPTIPAPATASSLSALANATEATKPVESTDKSRKEPRLATPPPPQQPARPEPTAQEQDQMGDEASRAMAGDGSQRPQRWGFWRGNR